MVFKFRFNFINEIIEYLTIILEKQHEQHNEILELRRLNGIVIKKLEEISLINQEIVKLIQYQSISKNWINEMREINIELWKKIESNDKK